MKRIQVNYIKLDLVKLSKFFYLVFRIKDDDGINSLARDILKNRSD